MFIVINGITCYCINVADATIDNVQGCLLW
jgi:hypothetical protein